MLTIFSLPYSRPFSCTDAANLSQEIEPAPTPILLSASAFQSFMSSPLRTMRQSLPEPTPAIPTSDLAPWPSAREMSCGPNAVSWISPEASAVRASAKRWNITVSICILYFAAYSGSSHRGESAGTFSMPCFTVTGEGSRALRASPCASATDGTAARRKITMEGRRTRGRTCRIIGTSKKIKMGVATHDALCERSRSRRSVRLDVRVAEDLSPLCALGAHECGELLGRVAGDFRPGGEHLALHVRGVVGPDQLAVQDLDHLRRGAGGSEDAVPYDRLDAGESGLRGGRHGGGQPPAREPERTHLEPHHTQGSDSGFFF